MFDKLRKQCELLKKNNPEKYTIIECILINESAFFTIDVDLSLTILRDLGVKEDDLKKVYLKLIEKEEK